MFHRFVARALRLARLTSIRADDFLSWSEVMSSPPDGAWVQWKIGSRFDVIPTIDPDAHLAILWKIRKARSSWAVLEREEDTLHVRVGIGTRSPGLRIGVAPSDVAAYRATYSPRMPISVQIKGIRREHGEVRLVLSGLMPPAEMRLEQGWEKPNPSFISPSLHALACLGRLQDRLDQTPPLSGTDAARLREARNADLRQRIMRGDPPDPETRGPESLQMSPNRLHGFLTRADQDVGEICSILDRGLDAWFSNGIRPDEHYPARLQKILRAFGHQGLADRFDAAWHRHF